MSKYTSLVDLANHLETGDMLFFTTKTNVIVV